MPADTFFPTLEFIHPKPNKNSAGMVVESIIQFTMNN